MELAEIVMNPARQRIFQYFLLHETGTDKEIRKALHIAKLNGRLCGAKRPHSVSEQPNFYQSLQSNPYNDSSHPSGGE